MQRSAASNLEMQSPLVASQHRATGDRPVGMSHDRVRDLQASQLSQPMISTDNDNYDIVRGAYSKRRSKPRKPTQQDIVNQVLERLNRKQLVEERERRQLAQSYDHKPTIIPKSEFDRNMNSKITAGKLTQIFRTKMKHTVTLCENEPAPNFNRLRKHRAFL